MRKSPSGVPAGTSERARSSSVNGARRGPVPAEQGAHEKAHRQQRSDRRRQLEEKTSGAPKELGERNSAPRAGQIDCPHVVQRNGREKRVNAQGEAVRTPRERSAACGMVSSGQPVDEKRSATNPQVEQDHQHNRSLDDRDLHVDGLRRHIVIGHEENYVAEHDLHKVE